VSDETGIDVEADTANIYNRIVKKATENRDIHSFIAVLAAASLLLRACYYRYTLSIFQFTP
jgi:hypothetical protein